MRKLFILLAILATTMSFAETTFGNVKPFVPTATNGIEKAYNDGKEGIKTIYGDAKSIAPELKSVVAELARILKTTSDKVWDILVLQQQVWSWYYLIITISALYLWWRFFRQYKIMSTDLDETGDIKTSQGVLTIILLVLVLTDSTISGTHFADMLTGFMNPEFGALKTIVELAKTLK